MNAARDDLLEDPQLELALRFFKHRWLDGVLDLLAESGGERLAFDDVDLDKDLGELGRAVGPQRLSAFASRVLTQPGPLPASRALRALEPELQDRAAQAFLRLLAANLAFRLRSDALLCDLLTHVADAEAPRLDAAVTARLLGRARSLREARLLLRAAPLSDPARAEALAALEPLPPPPPGTRLHVETDLEALEAALERVLRPAQPVPWSALLARPGTRRFLALRARGGWVTLLEEGDGPPPELARTLARAPGIRRVAWSRCGEDPDLLVVEGTRTLLDRARLAERLGEAPTHDDLSGALRALGILDLDPGHPRGAPELSFAALQGGPFHRRGPRGFAYAPPA